MTPLLDDIKIKFFSFLYGDESIEAFEQWIYGRNDLEEMLGGEDYFNLISLDFSKPTNRYELIKILERHIDRGEYETWKLRKLLKTFLNQEGNLLLILCEFYELYCNGFYFLDALGLGYGLAVRVPSHGYSSEYWQELTDEEKKNLLDSLLPGALEEARRVLGWLNESKIVIENEQDVLGHYFYIDNRTKKEKESNPYKVRKPSNAYKLESWWRKFWQ